MHVNKCHSMWDADVGDVYAAVASSISLIAMVVGVLHNMFVPQ